MDASALNLTYDSYLTGNATSLRGQYQEDMDHTGQILTRDQLLAQLSTFDLILGVKLQGSYGAGTDLSGLNETLRIQGGGLLPVEATADRYWVGFSGGFTLQRDIPVGSWSDPDGGAGTYYGDVATHQGARYEFEAHNAIERLGFEGSGHLALGGVKYFKDGSAGADALAASTGQGTWLFGGALGDMITGADKGDILVGGADNDQLAGGGGNDQYAYWLGDGHDIINDASGVDAIVFGGGITSDDVKLKIGKLANPLDHASFREALPGEVPVDLRIEIYHPQTGALMGSISVVDFRNSGSAGDVLRFAGDYEIKIFDFLAKQGVTSLATFTGTAGNDTFRGTDADEAFWAGGGVNNLTGGKGNDVFYAHEGTDTIDGGEGDDTIDYHLATGSISINLENGIATGPGNVTDRMEGIDNVVGTDFNDTIIGLDDWYNVLSGGKGNDIIRGLGDNDTLLGGEGNDTLDGGDDDDTIYGDRGNDTINGGADNDTLTYADLGAAVTVNLLTGTATASFTENGATVTETDTITGIENVAGTAFDDTLIASATFAGLYDGGLGDDRFVIQRRC